MELAGSTHARACAGACLHSRRTQWVADYRGFDGWSRDRRHRSAGGTYGDIPRLLAADAGAAGDGSFPGARSGDGECKGEDSGLPGPSPGPGAADFRRLAEWEPGTWRHCERGLYGCSGGDAWTGGEICYG